MVKMTPTISHESTADNLVHRYQFPAVSCGQQNVPGKMPVSNYSQIRAAVRKVRERDRRIQRAARQASLAEEQQRGYEDGYAAGYQTGQQEAQQHHQQSAEQRLGLINGLWNELSNLHQATLLNLGQPLTELIITVVQQVVNHELVTSPESLQQLVSDALSLLPQTQSMVLEINPLDRALLEPVIDKLPVGLSLRDNNTIKSGGCRLVSEHGEVDATVESRMAICTDAVHEQLVQHD